MKGVLTICDLGCLGMKLSVDEENILEEVGSRYRISAICHGEASPEKHGRYDFIFDKCQFEYLVSDLAKELGEPGSLF